MQGSPMASIVSLNSCLSSALSIVSGLAPSRRTLWLSRKPDFASSMQSVSPVCPPREERMESGFSFSIIRSIVSGMSGSM